MRPETRYARSGDVYVAYQVFGDGPFDLVITPGALSNIEYTLTVTDTQTGVEKTYTNPLGRLASVADTGAF